MNYERDKKKAAREAYKASMTAANYDEKMMNENNIFLDNCWLNGVKEITTTDMKIGIFHPNNYLKKIQSLSGETIYIYDKYCLHRIEDHKYRITKP
jgi:hypothetical protein